MGEIFDLEEVEKLNRAHADRYANEFWDDGHLAIPEDDLEQIGTVGHAVTYRSK